MQFPVLLCEMYFSRFVLWMLLFRLKGKFDTYTGVVCNSSIKKVLNEHQKPVKECQSKQRS